MALLFANPYVWRHLNNLQESIGFIYLTVQYSSSSVQDVHYKIDFLTVRM